MVIVKKYSFLFLIFFLPILLIAQKEEPIRYAKFPLKISIGNQVVGFPFQHPFKSFNPHFSIGTELGLNKNLKHRLLLSSSLGFIQNDIIGNAIPIDFHFNYRYTNKIGIYFQPSLGFGISKQFHPRDIYVLKPSNDGYEKKNDQGILSTIIGLKIEMGYDFSKKSNYPISIGIQHNFFIQTPYFDLDNFPIMPQTITNISLTYKFIK